MAVGNNQSWREFFEEFEQCPELWKVKSNMYKNKDKKQEAWEKLLNIYKNLDSEATISTLKNKINNIRSCYRRKLNKVAKSEKSGAGEDDVYVPSLWYFEILYFLRDNEMPTAGISSVDTDDDVEEIELETTLPVSKKICRNKNIRDEFLQTAVDHLVGLKTNKKKDESDIFAEGWAISFKKLDDRQKLYAKKAIDEILIMGQLNELTLNTVSPLPVPVDHHVMILDAPHLTHQIHCLVPVVFPVFILDAQKFIHQTHYQVPVILHELILDV